MTKTHGNRWIYAVSAAIFSLVALFNALMLLNRGITPFRMIALIAFALGTALLLLIFKQANSSEN